MPQVAVDGIIKLLVLNILFRMFYIAFDLYVHLLILTFAPMMVFKFYILFQSGLLSAGDIDKVMTDGLGMRYAFIGVLETMHLNADGMYV